MAEAILNENKYEPTEEEKVALVELKLEGVDAEHLQRLLPIRIVLKQEQGQVLGLVEKSFSLDWDRTRVNIFWSGEAFSNLGTTHILDGATHAEKDALHFKATSYNPLLRNCPVVINWKQWLEAFSATSHSNKFFRRNAAFSVKI